MSITAETLKGVPALQKPHLAWYFTPPPDEALYREFSRICGFAPLSLEWATDAEIQLAIATASDLKISIGLTSQPYQRCAKNKRGDDYMGPDYTADVDYLVSRLYKLADAKAPVGAVFFDLECFRPADVKVCWLSDFVHGAFAVAAIYYYGSGAITPNAGAADTGWAPLNYINPNAVDVGGGGVPLYFSEHATNQEAWLRSRAEWKGHIEIATVALGGCQRRSGSAWGKFGPPGIPPQNLWLMGLEINNQDHSVAGCPERFPLSTASLGYLYHEVDTQSWLADFLIYHQGAMAKPLAIAAA